jgi:uncharacterized membrane protein
MILNLLQILVCVLFMASLFLYIIKILTIGGDNVMRNISCIGAILFFIFIAMFSIYKLRKIENLNNLASFKNYDKEKDDFIVIEKVLIK